MFQVINKVTGTPAHTTPDNFDGKLPDADNCRFNRRADARAWAKARQGQTNFTVSNYIVVDLREQKTKRAYAEGEVQYTVEYKRVKYTSGSFVSDVKFAADPVSHPLDAPQYVKTRAEGRALLNAANESNVSGAYKFRLVRKVVTTA